MWNWGRRGQVVKGQKGEEGARRGGERGPPLAGRHTQANTSDASYQLLTEWIVLRKAEKVPGGFRRPENALCPPKPFCRWVYQGIYRELAREPPTNATTNAGLDAKSAESHLDNSMIKV